MADNKIMEEIFKTIDIITDHKLYQTEYLYTEDCIIVAKTNNPYVYKIFHEHEEFEAYSLTGEEYSPGQSVVVLFTDYSRITKKIILFTNTESGKIFPYSSFLNSVDIKGDNSYTKGIYETSHIPSLYFSVKADNVDKTKEYNLVSQIGTLNPLTDNKYYWNAIKFKSYFYDSNNANIVTQISPYTYLQINTDSYSPIQDRSNGTIFNPYLNNEIYNSSNSALDLGIGNTSYLTRFYYNSESSPVKQFTGGISTDGSGIFWVSSSDYRLKNNVKPIENGIEKINLLNPVSWDWKGKANGSEGFIAHEVEEIIPIAVKGQKDAIDADGNPIYQQIDLTKLIPTMVQSIKELSQKIEELKQEIEYLKLKEATENN